MPTSETSLAELLHEVRRIEEHRTILTDKKIEKIYQQLMNCLLYTSPSPRDTR